MKNLLKIFDVKCLKKIHVSTLFLWQKQNGRQAQYTIKIKLRILVRKIQQTINETTQKIRSKVKNSKLKLETNARTKQSTIFLNNEHLI